MAIAQFFLPTVLKWEGGFVNDPLDRGGATNKGVTISTFKKMGYDNDRDGDIDIEDLKKLTDDQAFNIMKELYWDWWKADLIMNQSVAEQLVDFVWGSGKWGIIIPQKALGLKADGIVGPRTLALVNDSKYQQKIHATVKQARLDFIQKIILNNPTQRRFEKGWIRRVNSFTFKQ